MIDRISLFITMLELEILDKQVNFNRINPFEIMFFI